MHPSNLSGAKGGGKAKTKNRFVNRRFRHKGNIRGSKVTGSLVRTNLATVLDLMIEFLAVSGFIE